MKKILLPFFLLLTNFCFAQVNLNFSLRAYYPFTGNANDVSGNNNNPVFNNATLTTDRFGNPNNAYHFDGATTYIRIPNSTSLNMTNTLSLSAWVKPMGFYTGPCHGNSVIMKGDAGNTPGRYLIWYDDNAGTNGVNCSGSPVNPTVENFYGMSTFTPPPGYSPYIQINQWYSVVLTYDGTTASLYVDCELKYSGSQGNISFTNAHDLFIGKINSAAFPYWVNGDIDEVRIYDRALTVDEVNVLGGCPINNTSSIINTYTPVLGLNLCTNNLTVEDAATFNIGDTVLLIQMKGAIIDSTNTAAFGSITDYKNSGNYEFNYVKSKSGNNVELTNVLTRQYDIPAGKVQLIRVPYYADLNSTDTLTCLPWDGNKGGVLVFNVQNTLTLNENIDVSGRGFKGGVDPYSNPAVFNCYENQYYYPPNPDLASGKGEGIAGISSGKSFGKGALANGGGGGNSHNSGGAGGGNIGTGGLGGYQFEASPCNATVPFDNRGISGKSLTYSNALNKIFLGGGGGAGHTNNPEAFAAEGGNGGGIIIFSANNFISNSKKIIANGGSAAACGLTTSGCHEGMGGGGAAGTVLLQVNNYIDNANIETKGGKGGDMTAAGFGRLGPGGGGSGGPVWLSNASLPTAVSISNIGGINGVCTAYGNSPWGATAGTDGQNLMDLILPVDMVVFQKNVDSVRIKDSVLSCNGFDFKGLGYTNTSPIATWQWYFGDGGSANSQNTSYTYTTAGTYTVKLIATDINGCIDSTMKDVTALPAVIADAGNDTSICSNGAVSIILNGVATGAPYLWSPAIYLDNPNIQNPSATINTTTVFYLTVTGGNVCSAIDSVTIYVNPLPIIQTLTDTTVCKNSVLVLNTTAGIGSYNWSPGIYVSDSTIASPLFIDNQSRILTVTGTNAAGCSANDTVSIDIKPLPLVKTIEDTLICSTNIVTLFTNGAQTYSWTPPIYLSDPNIANPVYSGNQSQTYYVTGTGVNGCEAIDTVTVNVNLPMTLLAPPDKNICENSFVQLDGNNGNTVEYLWSPVTYLNNAAIINPVTTTPVSTTYQVKISDKACNYDSTFNVVVTLLPKPLVSVNKSNDIDCANPSAGLIASGGIQYAWSPATGLNSTSIPNPVSTVTNTQQYLVTVTNAAGCSNKDSIIVFVNSGMNIARYMPNAFTPNGDGLNDCYGIKTQANIKKLQFFIFNRYGEQVFATANPAACWDGIYKGKRALAGSYVYVIKAETDCGTEEKKGSFLLIR